MSRDAPGGRTDATELRTDAAILRYVARERLAYPTVAAVDLGIEPDEARRRCETLTEELFLEPVSPETVYRITERGAAFLDVYSDVEGTPDADRRVAERSPVEGSAGVDR